MCYSTKKKNCGLCQAADEAQGDIQNYDRGHHGGNGDEPPEFLLSF